MTRIKHTSLSENDKRAMYLLTKANNMISVKDIEDGTTLKVDDYVNYVKTDDDGNEIELLTFMSDGVIYATQSKTFISSFLDIFLEMFELDEVQIEKLSGKTKNGRSFVNCTLA